MLIFKNGRDTANNDNLSLHSIFGRAYFASSKNKNKHRENVFFFLSGHMKFELRSKSNSSKIIKREREKGWAKPNDR